MRSRRVDLLRVGRTGGFLVVAAAVGAKLTGIGDGSSVLAGGAVMLANYHLIRMLVSRLIQPEASKVRTLGLFTLKLLLFFALLAGAFLRLPIEPMSFAVGASQLLAALVIEAAVLGEPLENVPGDA